ncbi:MAG: hypothetical protein V8R23_09520 [Alphaproteobacteria bacterium]
MKLSILLAGSILTSAIVGNAYAQTCGAQPSCSTLGYTYTGSTSDCLSPALKCPFNTSYFNCVKKADAVKNMVLDWSKKKSFNPTSSTYYVSSYGIVIGKIQDITNKGGWISVNGISISTTGTKAAWADVYTQVAPGDSISAYGTNPEFYFVPYKNI